jgi:hypothetical protein
MERCVRIVWTLFKIIIGLAVAIPVGMLVLGMTFGLVGIAVALVSAAVRLACIGLVGYGLYRVARFFFAPAAKPPKGAAPELASVDPYYVAAMRELDSELRR